MMNTERNTIIPRTDSFMGRFETRMKFLLGHDVHLDQDYTGWQSVQGERYDGPCSPVLYENGLLYVIEKDAGEVAVLRGDLAEYRGRLMADGCCARHSISGLRSKVRAYMEKNAIDEYTSEVGRRALWVKMMPQQLIMQRVKVYELTLETNDE